MMKMIFLKKITIALICCSFLNAKAQTDTTITKVVPKHKIAIFAPLYLDSLFGNKGLKYKDDLPKFVKPSIEFVQGAQIALDSLYLIDQSIEAYIFDTKSYTQNINSLIKNKQLDQVDLIIGNVKDLDFKKLADYAAAKKTPFISVTYPNDGGITNNAYTTVLNATLKAHCEAIYSYLLQNHGTDMIYLCRKKGTQEDKVASYFKTLNEQDGKPLLTLQTINTDSSFNASFLTALLDSNRQSIIVGTSLDEPFATALTTACSKLQKKYPLTLIGMPNWDGFAALHKKEVSLDLPIYFTTTYFNNKWDNYSKMLNAAYFSKYKTKPSDMAFKGFESVLMFSKILIKHSTDFMANINDKSAKIFCDYNIKPVLKKGSITLDYFENKHLYFIKMLNGVSTKAW